MDNRRVLRVLVLRVVVRALLVPLVKRVVLLMMACPLHPPHHLRAVLLMVPTREDLTIPPLPHEAARAAMVVLRDLNNLITVAEHGKVV